MLLGGCIFSPVFCWRPSCVTAFIQNACTAVLIRVMWQPEKHIFINRLQFLRHAVSTSA